MTPASEHGTRPLVALIGNPNTGKTTLFNALSGSRARVGNYPGLTVERRTARMLLSASKSGEEHPSTTVELLDLPGTYSLSARSGEERVAISGVLGLHDYPRPDLVVLVVDAGQLVRNLYLGVQLIELGVPLVVALNMIDEVDPAPDAKPLAARLGVPCVPTNARGGVGIERLREVITESLGVTPHGSVTIGYDETLLADARDVAEALPAAWRGSTRDETRDLALAMWALNCVDDDPDAVTDTPDAVTDSALRARCQARFAERAAASEIDDAIITARYRWLDEHIAPLCPSLAAAQANGSTRAPLRMTDRVDMVLLHPVWGFAIFIAIMLFIFQSLFSWSDPAIRLVEAGFAWLSGTLQAVLPAGILRDLLIEGVVGGVGNVVVFLPQILLLFLMLGLLEDSGYMARAAYLMDRIMKALGLHGRAFVPMLSGCACAIPAIMATRTMERQRDRLLTMLVVPLMTCSARLPIYTLIIAALFPPMDVFGFIPVQGLLMMAMYLLAVIVTLIAAAVIGRTVVKARRVPLLLELPPYRLPTVKVVLRQTMSRGGVFLKEAGTVILVFTIILWALLSFPKHDATSDTTQASAVTQSTAGASPDAASADAASADAASAITHSYGGRLGKAIEPVIAPLGFDWRIGIGIIGAFAAREVFVSTMGLVYGIGGDIDENSQPLREKIRQASHADGRPVYSPLVGLSLMIFFAFACQCMSTLAVVRRETGGYKWPLFMFSYMTALAWLSSFVVYQGGRLLGFG
jgi:ferrous iron transport protein B